MKASIWIITSVLSLILTSACAELGYYSPGNEYIWQKDTSGYFYVKDFNYNVGNPWRPTIEPAYTTEFYSGGNFWNSPDYVTYYRDYNFDASCLGGCCGFCGLCQ